MSFGNMQAQQEQLTTTQPQPELAQVEQQHPLLSAISGNNYADGMERAHYPWHSQYPQHHQQHHNPYLQFGGAMMGAASNHNGAYAGSASSGHSGYGMDSSGDYDTPPSGSYSSYHPSGGGGSGGGGGGNAPAYPPPHPPQQHSHSHPHPPPHPPQYHAPKPPPSTKPTPPKKKKSASSVMSALTLLSFFFFVNMLQNCIKEHITDMNPTVMVLTAGGGRNRFNKLAEMNSREQTSTTASDSAAAASASAAQAVSSWQQAELVPPPSSAVVPVIVTPSVTLHTPYSSGLVTNKPVQSHQPSQSPHQHHHHHHQDDVAADGDYYNGQREPSSVADFYPNRTHIDHSVQSMGSDDSDYYQHHHYYPERKRHHYMDNGNGYSNGGPGWAYVGNNKRYSSSASLGAQSGVSSYTDNARYRHVHDDVDDNDDDADYDQRYSHRHRNDDVAYADRGPHRRNGDSFYTRNN